MNKYAVIILGAALAAVVTVVVLKLLGVENPGVLGGGVAGGVAGALAGRFATKKKPD